MGDEPNSFWKDVLMKLLDLLAQSVLISGLVALLMTGVACYLWATGVDVPEQLFILLGTVIGFFFGAKQGTAAEATRHNKQYAKLSEIVSATYTQNPKVPQAGSGDYRQRGQQ